MFERILFPTDFSKDRNSALGRAFQALQSAKERSLSSMSSTISLVPTRTGHRCSMSTSFRKGWISMSKQKSRLSCETT